MDPALARTLVVSQFPALKPATVTYLGEGCDSTAFEVNGELVFRFPKRADVDEQLLIETRILDALTHAGAPLPIPCFVHRGVPSAAFPYHFAGYRKLPGIEANRLDPADVPFASLAAPLGRFLGWLHSFPCDEARRLGAVARDWTHVMGEYRAEAFDCFDHIGSVVTADELAPWRTFLNDAPALAPPAALVLLHSDFYQEHILLDPQQHTLAGIIDWGDVEVGDPAFDLAGVFSWGGPRFTRDVLAHYGRQADEAMFERARFFAACRSAVDLKHGIERGQAEHVTAGRRGLRYACLND